LLTRGVFLALLMIKAATNYSNNDFTSFVFFLLSRLWISLLWTIFIVELSKRRDSTAVLDGNSVGARDSESGSGRHANLSQMTKYDLMPTKFHITVFSMVTVCGLLDMSILRLLPWLPTEFSKYVNGYPNLFALRCCVYGSNVCLVLQCIASVVLLVNGGQNATNLVLSVFLVVLSISLMLKTFMETVFGIQKERSDKMITVLELDKHLLRSVAIQASSRESFMKKLDEIANLRFSDSEIVWRGDNPMRTSIIFDDRSVMENTVNPLHRDDNIKEPERKVDEALEGAVADVENVAAEDAKAAISQPGIETGGDSGGQYSTNLRYADKTVEVMKNFMASKNESEVPVYIPLDEIKAELTAIMEAVNAGKPFDEKRLDYLLLCMNFNPDYIKERQEESRLWREQMDVFSQQCLFSMRGFVPPNIFSASLSYLVGEVGISEPLAKRLLNKKCLWLLRMDPEDIQRLHEADLLGRCVFSSWC